MVQLLNKSKIYGVLALLALCVTVSHSVLVGAPGEIAKANAPECNDGLDNDSDGFEDYPDDPDCRNAEDDSEEYRDRQLFLNISDGQTEVEAGDSSSYVITLQTDSDIVQSYDVRLLIPEYTNLLNAGDGGTREGAFVYWRDVIVHPDSEKKLHMSIQVHPDAKDGELLIAEASANGEKATDTTAIVSNREIAPPLEIFVNDAKIFAEPDEELHYKITVDNGLGPDRLFDLHTTLPPFLRFIDSTGNYKREQRALIWYNQPIAAGERVVYDLFAVVERDAPEFTSLRLRVSSGPALGSDTTTVLYEQIPPTAIDVSVNDGYTAVRNGENLTYEIVIRNNQGKLVTGIEVTDALPVYTEFVSATEGGYWTGKDVHWEGLTISPKGKRVLQVTLRVRSDAPLGAQLKNSVHVAGREAVDMTEVSTFSQSNQPPRAETSSSRLLRKVADRSEVRPGDTVTYTIYLRNTLQNTIRNILVEDRLDLSSSTVLDAQYGEMVNNQLVWTVPSLDPGQEWKVSYTVRIHEDVPHGTSIANVVTVSGDGMETISLTERVRTTELRVVTSLPKSGAPLDVLFAGFMAVISGAPTLYMRKKRLLPC